MGALISNQVEAVTANLATLEAQLDDLAARARTASVRYAVNEEARSADLEQFLGDLDNHGGS